MTDNERELELLKFLGSLSVQLEQARDTERALRFALRETRDFMGATEACIAAAEPGQGAADILFSLPSDAAWDTTPLTRFIRNEHPAVPHDMLLAPIRSRGREWAVLALRRGNAPFERGTGHTLSRIGAAITRSLDTIERERLLEIRDRIDRKIMEQLRPKDLFYQILDGLRSLTRYDHSSAILILGEEDDALEIVAEQIAWRKAKSRRIGLRLQRTDQIRGLLGADTVFGFDRIGEEWIEWDGRDASALARLLDYNRDGSSNDPEPREASMLCATLSTRDGLSGALKVASLHRGALGRYDAELLARFRSQAAIAINNSRRTESLHARMLEAERKHAMAELARGVSHDVNNAFGSVIPLVQQLQQDLREGRFEPDEFASDLDQINRSLQVARRIFAGMLSFARGGARRTSEARVRPAIEDTISLLANDFRRRGIEVRMDLDGDLPDVAGGQSDLEQVVLNLLTNARDAMRDGGRLSIRARPLDGGVEIEIRDSGPGLDPGQLARIQEPFYTTKPHGAGLGLSICRSILWEMGGRLEFRSHPGEGTTVTVVLAAPGATRGPAGETA